MARETERFEEGQRIDRSHVSDIEDRLAAHRDRQDLGLQALAPAFFAGNRVEIGGQLLALRIRISIGIPASDDLQDALPFDEPIGAAPIHRHVIDAHLLIPQPLHQRLLHLARHVLPGHIVTRAHMLGHRAQDLRIVVAILQGRNSTFAQRERRIGHHQGWVDLFAASDAEARRARPVRRVEREIARLQLVHGEAVLGACQRQREEMLPFR